MGNGPSRFQQQSPQLPGQTQSVNAGITPPPTQPSKIYDLQFILANPPPIIPQPQQNTSKSQVQLERKLDAIKATILEYNKTWNFGNQLNGQPQSLLKKETYNEFLVFVTNLIKGVGNTSNQMRATINANARSYQDKQNIVREIHKLVVSDGGNQLVNKFFKVGMSEIFPNFSSVNPEDTMMVTLLGLASIIGAEHIVIYLLMIGADPSITKTDNRDSATLMLSFQIGFYKLLQQQQPINQNYFIILPRILYILFLLGSIGEGVDLSAIFETNEKKINENNSKKPTVPVKSSILNMLAQMPGNTSDETAKQTLQNGGSIPLLLEILERNNSFKPKFFKDVNSLETPYDLNVLYNVLMNLNIDDQTKIRLIQLLVIKYYGNITNVPTFVVKTTNISIFDIILLIVNGINTTRPQTKAIILEIFSSNEEFKKMLDASGIDLRQFLTSNSTNNKNAIIRQLRTQVELLKQKNNLMTEKLEKFLENFYKTQVEASLVNSQIRSLTPNAANPFTTSQGFTQQVQPQIQPQIQPSKFGTNQRLSQPIQSQNKSTSLSQIPVLQSQQMQQPGASLEKKSFSNRLQFWKKGNNGQVAAQKNSQSNLRPVNTTLPQAASQMNSSKNLPQNSKKGLINRFKEFRLFGKKNNKGPTIAQPAPLSSSPPISLQSPILSQTDVSLNKPLNTTKSSELSQTVSPLSSPPNLPIGSTLPQTSASLNKPLNTTTSPGLLQPVLPLITPQNSTSVLPVAQPNQKSKPIMTSRARDFFGFGKKNQTGPQAGGKKIQMRTYHFLKHKKYSERAFIAERPIIAADNAYDFMKLHYDIGSKKITFTIHDRVNNKKYKYTARTLKDGTNVIKSAK
jgi:hypothetical protein